MNKIDVLSTPFYEFVCEPQLTEKIYNKLKGEVFSSPNILNSTTNTETNWYDPDLFIWFKECLESVAHDLHFNDSIKLEIISCWANKTKKLEAHHFHHHPNSLISGVFYPHDSESNIVFETTDIWFEKFTNLKISKFNNGIQYGKPNIHKYKPKAGCLLLFPSHIPHKVSAVTKDQERYSIAFNTFVSGDFGINVTNNLSLKSKSL